MNDVILALYLPYSKQLARGSYPSNWILDVK